MSEVIHRTEFIGDYVAGVLQDAINWLQSPAPSPKGLKNKINRKNEFFYLDMQIRYMEEVGYIVTIYHGEIK